MFKIMHLLLEIDGHDEIAEDAAIADKVNTIKWGGYTYEKVHKVPFEEAQPAGEPAPSGVKVSSVEHPSHYNMGQYEVIDVINDWQLNFQRGNAVKYIARAGRKDAKKEIEDLEKARFYLNYEIERLKKATVQGGVL